MKNLLLVFIFIVPFISFGQYNPDLYVDYYKALEKGNTKKAHRELMKISEVEANTFLRYLTTAHYFAQNENLDSAVIYLIYAMDYHRFQPISPSEPSYYKVKDSLLSEAIKIYDAIIESNPIGLYYCNRGNIKSEVGQYPEALIDMKTAVELEPKNAVNHYNLGLIYRNLNELDSALMNYDLALKYDPEYGACYLNKGFLLIKLGSFKLAIEQFTTALDLIKSTKELSYTINNIGYCYLKLENFKAAKTFVEQSIEMNPLNSYAFRNLALIEISLEKKNAACKAIEKSIELGFVHDYGDEILELKKDNCTN